MRHVPYFPPFPSRIALATAALAVLVSEARWKPSSQAHPLGRWWVRCPDFTLPGAGRITSRHGR